jgi:hypothetical protein
MPFKVELLGDKLTREPHPLPLPTPPFDKKAKDYPEKLAVYEGLKAEYDRVDSGLKRFMIVSMECESGMIVDAKCLNYNLYKGKLYTADLLAENEIRTIPDKKGK